MPHRTAGCGKSSLRPLMAGSSPSLPDGSNPSAAIVQSASDVQCSRLLKTTLGCQQEERQEGEHAQVENGAAIEAERGKGRLHGSKLLTGLQGFGCVLAVGVAGNLKDFLDAPRAVSGAGDMNDHVNRLAYQRFNGFG